MKNKISISIGIILLIWNIYFPTEMMAKETNVSDWLETNENSEVDEADTNESPSVKADEESVEKVEKNESIWISILKTIIALFFILALIYALLRFLNHRNKRFNHVKTLENLGGIAVGQNKSIQIIRVGKKYFLIGVGDDIHMLQEINDEEMKQELDVASEELMSVKPGKFLSSLLKNSGSKQGEGRFKNEQKDFKNLFAKELQHLSQNRKELISQSKQKEDSHE
ncbi:MULTISPECIES: flagellar biosynthetic protein FliO [unclassified Virgibacillus]|uniref:flagellar biosynthetic protein FliO n=1 Tax=unclassified Virgibacillus TaxID=2620237 RepID=UPI0024DE772A|nr:flagellar biosynthetic protein FliO [Virgibacillus sp. LDC-1]